MSLQSYTLNFEFTYDDHGVLKVNKQTMEGYIFVATQAQFQLLTYSEIIQSLEIIQLLTTMANKHAMFAYSFEKITNKDYRCVVQYPDGSFDAIFDALGLISVAVLAPPKHVEERIERFKIIQQLIGIMETSPLVKISMIRA